MKELQEAQSAINAMYARELLRVASKSVSLFATQRKKLTRYDRLKYKALMYIERVRDAWLVLIGKAEIQD